MEKYLAALLFCVTSATHAELIKGTIPIICTDVEQFASTMEEFGEVPLLTGLSNRDTGEGLMSPFSMVVFANSKTGTFTIAEKVADMICVIGIGENLKPYPMEEAEGKKTGL